MLLHTRKNLVVVLLVAFFVVIASANAQKTATDATCTNTYNFHASNATVGVSFAFLGNDWRKTMESGLKQAISHAIACHEIGSVIYTYANTSSTQQISQIQTLILKHVDLILVDATSTTGLNRVIGQAVSAGIPVINFDTQVSNDQARILTWDYSAMGSKTADFIVKQLNGSGNVLVVRGLQGTLVDKDEYNAWINTFKKYPNIHVVGTVFGNWDESTVQSAVAGVLPNLPKVDAVAIGGGAYGVIQAFQAAGRTLPVLAGSNYGEFINWWAKHPDFNTLSFNTFPACGEVAFYLGQFILNGASVKKGNIFLPAYTVTSDSLQAVAKATPVNGTANLPVSAGWVYKNIVSASN